MRCAILRLTTLLVLTLLHGLSAGPATAEDFRIDTDFFVGTEKEPKAEILTVFQGGNVYDFQLKQNEITIFEPRRGMITLLDTRRELRASLTTTELLDAAVSLQTKAVQEGDPIFSAAANPAFQTTSENVTENGVAGAKLTFAGHPLTYRVIGHASRHPDAAKDYKYFADWSARLNSVRPGNLPAGARLVVNEALGAKGLLPVRVELEIQTSRFPKSKVEMRTQHLVNWTLSQEDRRRIDEAGNQLARFQLVSFDEYLKPTTIKSAAAAPAGK